MIGDVNNINLDNGCAGGLTENVTGVGVTPFAMAETASGFELNWPGVPTPLPRPAGACTPAAGQPWPLVDGWLRVEYQTAAGNWIGVTQSWLQLGFARGLAIPNALGGNSVHRNAILIFQELADRNADGKITAADAPSDATVINANSRFSWYPINFFDPREGFPRDVNPGLAGSQCYVNGLMNAVELDVGNLNQWLLGNIGAGGPSVNYSSQNGYLVFFSDRRGMMPDVNNGNITQGEYGFEDVINSASPTGTPDGVLEATPPGGFSPEDVDENNALDAWGAANVGNGMRIAGGTVGNPYKAIDCLNGGRQNVVTGARHVLRLVDGGLNNVPVRPDNGLGGFTVAAENPVYVFGDYNSNVTDPFWLTPGAPGDINHAAAAVIADAVTLLSNPPTVAAPGPAGRISTAWRMR